MDQPRRSSNESSTSALEQFRRQWREEVSARGRQTDKRPIQKPRTRQVTVESSARPERPINRPPARHPLASTRDDEDHAELIAAQDNLVNKVENLKVREVDEDDFSNLSTKEPKSALEHYERAVEKEGQGNLRDSLAHYRTAYRLDAKVDQSYKNKYFPTKSKPEKPNSPGPVSPALNTAHHSSEASDEQPSFSDLIDSYGDLEIPNAEPLINGDIAPSCGIRKLPTEVLVEVLQQIAVTDPAVFGRLALVCKRLAYHVFKENRIWKRVALGPEFGLAGQQYKFATDVQGREAIFQTLEEEEKDDDEDAEPILPPVDGALFSKSTEWREFFHSHPRIRYSGIYISTVNYTRPGGVSATLGTWGSSVHVVTYYRYLRFFRDGTCISLLTTHEPVDVVHHITKENVHLVRSGGKDSSAHPAAGSGTMSAAAASKEGQQPLPPSAQNILKHALRGRWRLCHPSTVETSKTAVVGENTAAAGDLHIETEGVGPRYTYTLHLGVRSGSKSQNVTKNNKLVWRGFWSHNHLTDDWSEFQLKNDKAFWFSRVKSYGLGY